jgi:two-component system phosphate regulon sensor histidine kinase PhoR
MFRSIRWRIAILYTLLVSAVILALGIMLTRYVSQVHLRNLERSVISQTSLLADVLAVSWPDSVATDRQNSSADALSGNVRRWAKDINGRVTVLSTDGTVLGESDDDPLLMENHLDRPEIQQAMREGVGVSTRFSTTLGARLMYAASVVEADGQRLGFVRLALPLQEVEKSITQIQRQIWLILLSVLLFGALLAFAAAQWIARPVKNIANLADQITAGRAVRFPYLNRRDEIGHLSQSLEHMARQLHERIDDLQNEQQKLSGLLAQMSDGVIIVDPYGLISEVNAAAAQIFNTTEERVEGQSLVRALGYFQLHELWQQSHVSGEGQVISLEMMQQKRFLQVVATPLGGALQDFTMLLCQDMTHIRRLETVRRDFISNISHELRTPLASLKAITETLQLSAIDDPENARHFLERMETEIDALTQMVNELLELARIESGRVPLNLRREDACRLAENAVERLSMQAQRAGVTLTLECQPNLRQVLADGPRLEQVLVNIIHNAIKFTNPGGQVSVFVRPEGKQVCFGVKDTGVGIPAEMLPRVFERFYKTDPSRSERGTGLGLSIARHLVESHSGRIWAESQLGAGSTFYFTIPTA